MSSARANLEDPETLKACISNLIGIQALAPTWIGRQHSEIVSTILNVLLEMLNLDFAYGEVRNSSGESPFEAIRMRGDWPPAQGQDFLPVLHRWLQDAGFRYPALAPNPMGQGAILAVPLNFGQLEEIGVLAVGAARADFPTGIERLLLNVAKNQVILALNEIRRRSEQKQVAEEMERRVTERTQELLAVNAEREREVKERQYVEVSLRTSERRWKRLFENSSVGIAMTDLEGRFEMTNAAYQELLGYREEELHKLSFFDITVEEFRDHNAALLMELRQRKRQQFEIEKQYRRKDGTLIWVRNNVSLVLGADGDPRYIMAIVEDISERKRAQQELQQMVDFVPQIIVVLEPDGKWILANRVAREYMGVAGDAQVSRESARAAVHPDDLDRMQMERDRGLDTSAPFETEARLRRYDGVYRWFLFRYNPLLEDRVVRRWYATATEIEARKQEEERVQMENLALREEIAHVSMSEEVVGTSPALHAVMERVAKVGPTDSTVLILGETGTGKELIARAIHRRSQRSRRPFVSVSCAAIPGDLIASELFGHEKGAFTGAIERRPGRFELARGGTIFLDEIGELPFETQTVLLRVLQEREFERVGGTTSVQADVRVIAATNRDLEAYMAAGHFRSDLYYRLNVFPIELPPLRERKEDIALLVAYFLDRYARKAGKSIRQLDKRSLEFLKSYDWPGNIRELQNVIERSVILPESGEFAIDESWLPRHPAPELKRRPKLVQKLADHEKEMIENALRESRGQVYGPGGAAVRLGIPRSTLESKIRALKINKYRFKV